MTRRRFIEDYLRWHKQEGDEIINDEVLIKKFSTGRYAKILYYPSICNGKHIYLSVVLEERR